MNMYIVISIYLFSFLLPTDLSCSNILRNLILVTEIKIALQEEKPSHL
jgi:hypothetical protein